MSYIDDVMSKLDAESSANIEPTQSAFQGNSYIDDAISRLKQSKSVGVEEISKRPTFTEEYGPMIGSIAGGIVGTIFAPQATIPSFLARAGTSVIGSMLGTEAGQQSRDSRIPIEEYLKLQGENAAKSAAYQVGGDIAGTGVKYGANALYNRLFPSVVDPSLVAAQKALQERGSTLSMGQARPGSLASTIEGGVRQGVMAKGVFDKLAVSQDKALKSMRNEITDNVDSIPVSDLGNMIKSALAGGHRGLADKTEPIYTDLMSKASNMGLTVDTQSVKEAANAVLDQQAKLGNVGLTDQGGTVLKGVAKAGDKLSFSDAKQLRTDLLAINRYLDPSDPSRRNVSNLITTLDSAMQKAADSGGSEFANAWREVNSLYSKSKAKLTQGAIRPSELDTQFISNLVEKKPSSVVDSIIAPGNEQEIIDLKIALKRAEQLGSTKYSDIWPKVQNSYMESLLNKASVVDKEGETIGYKLLKSFSDPKISRTMKATLTRDQIDAIKRFAEVSNAVQSVPEGSKMLAPIIQAGAVADMLTFRFANPVTDTAIILSPAVLARMLTNPNTVNTTLRIAGSTKTTPLSPTILSKFAAYAEEANKQEENSNKKQ